MTRGVRRPKAGLVIPIPTSAVVPPSAVARSRTPTLGGLRRDRPGGHSIRWAGSLGLALLLVLSTWLVLRIPAPNVSATPAEIAYFGNPFSFGAAGDYGFTFETQAVMAAMGRAGLDFAVGLGDFAYGDAPEATWCGAFEAQVGDGHVLLITGNHDSGESSGGNIDVYRLYCNFGISATVNNEYGKEYYFDYPSSGPLARFILTACGTDLNGTTWACAAGDPHYMFVSNAIDGARSAGIPWVFVGMHKDCISDGGKSCEIGEAFQDLLLFKKVDLVLQAHDHNYQRSQRLLCAQDDVFRPECIAPPGARATVITIVGTGGRSFDGVGGTLDASYFATENASTHGFLKVYVTPTALDLHFVPVNGTYADAFQMSHDSTPSSDFSVSANPTNLALAPGQLGFVSVRIDTTSTLGEVYTLAVSSTGDVTGTCSPSTVHAGDTSTCTLSGQTLGTYDVNITGTSGSIVRSRIVALSIATSPGPDSMPPLITIESPADASRIRPGTVTVTGQASDDHGVDQVEVSADGSIWTIASGTTSWSGILTLAAGEQWIQARATDAAGNVGTTTVHVFVEPAQAGTLLPLGLTESDLIAYAGLALVTGLVTETVIRVRRRRRRRKGPRSSR